MHGQPGRPDQPLAAGLKMASQGALGKKRKRERDNSFNSIARSFVPSPFQWLGSLLLSVSRVALGQNVVAFCGGYLVPSWFLHSHASPKSAEFRVFWYLMRILDCLYNSVPVLIPYTPKKLMVI